MAMLMTHEEFKQLQKERNISYTVMAGDASQTTQQKEIDSATPSPKYRNRKVYVYPNGRTSSVKDYRFGELVYTFDSEKEYARYNELKLLEKAGCIKDFEWQKEFVIQEAFTYMGKKVKAIKYRADFYYVKDGKEYVEDVKGYDKKTGKHVTTKDFELKWKLLKHRYPNIIFTIY